jgi:hypothetical protein
VVSATSAHNPGAAIRDAWVRASWAQKAILILLPIAFLALRASFASRAVHLRKPAVPATQSASSATAKNSLPAAIVSPPPPPAQFAASEGASVSGKTRARMAADAIAAGAYADAVSRYDDLTRAYPEQAVYRETARILRSRLSAPVPSFGSKSAAP